MKHTSLAAAAVAVLLPAAAWIAPASAADQPTPISGMVAPSDQATAPLPDGESTEWAPVETLLDQAESVLDAPASSPPPLDAATRPADLTLLLRDLAARTGEMNKTQRHRVNRLLARPTDSGSPLLTKYKGGKEKVRCTKHVCVHWALKGVNRPAAKDKNRNKVPDWVETTAKTMEQVWKTEVNKLGYRAPRGDKSSKHHGPNGKLDIYLANLAKGYYGYCTTDDPKRNTKRAVSGYCVLDNDYKRSQFRTAPIKALRVTAAHEFFHAIQFSYDWREDSWLMEGTATWMEEQVYDSINDNRQYLKAGSPHNAAWLPLDYVNYSSSNYHQPYGTWTFFQYLSDHLGKGIVRSIWNQADNSTPAKPGRYSLPAIKAAIEAKNTTLNAMWAGYNAANVNPKAFYSEGAAYPPVSNQNGLAVCPTTATTPAQFTSCKATIYGLYHLSAWTEKVNVTGLHSLAVTAALTGSSAFGITVTTRTGAGAYAQYTMPTGTGTLSGIDLNGVTTVWITVANAGIRMQCNKKTVLSCHGNPLDDAVGSAADPIGTITYSAG